MSTKVFRIDLTYYSKQIFISTQKKDYHGYVVPKCEVVTKDVRKSNILKTYANLVLF